MKKALIVWGGWDGHEPKECGEIAAKVLTGEGFEVEVSNSMSSYCDAEKMKALNLVVPIWTMGAIEPAQENGLIAAVMAGVGLAGWHGGMCDAFRGNTSYQFMTGGQWVAHPGGCVEYDVNITDHQHPITRGIPDFKMNSEQYYMHTDPGNKVLATTTFHKGYEAPWVEGTVMPVVWTRHWGVGRVFYSSLGHCAKDMAVPESLEIIRRGMLWAAR